MTLIFAASIYRLIMTTYHWAISLDLAAIEVINRRNTRLPH